MFRIVVLFLICFYGWSFTNAKAEYRVAMLIDNTKKTGDISNSTNVDLKALARSLKNKHGFRCEIASNLDDKQLKEKLESFTSSTPIRSTALIFFSGKINNTDKEITLLSSRSDRQGYSLERLLEKLNNSGGSLINLVVVDAPISEVKKLELPEGNLVAFAKPKVLETNDKMISSIRNQSELFQENFPNRFELSGKGSQAISTPDQFKPGSKFGDHWVNGRGMVFCWCPPGKYRMGSPEQEQGRYSDEVQKDVIIAEGFWISKYELTSSNWRGNRNRKAIGNHKLHPINAASQSKDIKAREIAPLNKSEWQSGRLPEDWEYALPSEEAWEYAARAGTDTAYFFGDENSDLPKYANFSDRSHFETQSVYSYSANRILDDGSAELAIVGSYEPNPWGIHDIYGNIAEWCDNAVVRGGSWVSLPETCRSAYRDPRNDRAQEDFIGCRLVIRKRQDPKK